LHDPSQLTSFIIREAPCFGQELRLRWFSASVVFAGEIPSEKLRRVWRLVIGYGVVGAGQTHDDLIVPDLKLNIRQTALHVRISEMCKQVKLKLGTMLGTWGTANNAVCMGSASQGAPLHNGRIPWRVTHALPKACALYCFVSSTFTARNAVELRLLA
jgi:hypothetical protein